MEAAGSTRIAPLADMAMHPATASAQEAFATHLAKVHQAVHAFSDHAASIIRQQEDATCVEVARLRLEISRLSECRGSPSPSRSRRANWEAPDEMLAGATRSDASSAITAMEALSVNPDDFVGNLPGAPTSPVALQPFPPRVEFLAPPVAGAAAMLEDRTPQSKVSSVETQRRESESKQGLSITKQLTEGLASCLPGHRRFSTTPGTASPIRKVTSVFPDPEELKAKCRDAVFASDDCGPPCNTMKESGWAQAIARSIIFEYVTLSVIFLSAIWIAVDVDSNTAEDPRDAKLHFKIMDQFFCMYFLVELLVRFAAYSVKWYALRDSWFLFDGLLVLFTVIDTWVLLVVIVLSDASTDTDIGTGGVGRLFRVLRLARMARMVRLVRAVPELMVLIKGMAAAARSVILTFTLLAILIYVFAVLLRQLTDGTKLGDKYFRSVRSSMGNLLLRGTLPDQADFLIESGEESLLYGIFLLIFVLMGSLTLMNMLIGILVQVVSVVAHTEREETAIATLRSSMSDLMMKHGVDTDGDHRISRSEFEHLLTIPEAVKCMSSLGVDVVSLVDYVDFIFEAEGVSKDLSFPEIFDLLQQLRSGNNATVRDIVDLRRFLSNQLLPDPLDEKPGNGAGAPAKLSRKSLAASVMRTLTDRSHAPTSPR